MFLLGLAGFVLLLELDLGLGRHESNRASHEDPMKSFLIFLANDFALEFEPYYIIEYPCSCYQHSTFVLKLLRAAGMVRGYLDCSSDVFYVTTIRRNPDIATFVALEFLACEKQKGSKSLTLGFKTLYGNMLGLG